MPRTRTALIFGRTRLAVLLRRTISSSSLDLRNTASSAETSRSNASYPGQLQLMFEQLMSQSGGEELEPELDPQTEAREDAELEQQIEEAKKTRPRGKGNKPRRETIRTDGIERQVHLREIPEEERGCSRCGKLKKPLGKDVRRRLEYVPGHFIEHEYHLEKYACGKCREGVTRAEGTCVFRGIVNADSSRR